MDSVTQWLPWNPDLPTGEYLIAGGTWEHVEKESKATLVGLVHAYWNGVSFIKYDDWGETEIYYPEFYLANIPEVPTCSN